MVIGHIERLEAFLTDLRGDVYFQKSFYSEFVDFLRTFLLVHFLEAGTVGSRVIFLLYLQVDRHAILEREALLSRSSPSAYRVIIQRIIRYFHHFIQW